MKSFLIGTIFGVIFFSITWVALGASKFFDDVASDAWYSDSVNNLKDKGIIEGYPDGNFRPSYYVNRAELAVIIDNLIEYVEVGEIEAKALTEAKKSYYNSDITDELLSKIEGIKLPDSFKLEVPFTSQAPNSNWAMPYQEACEEASMIMVKYFLDNKSLNADIVDEQILSLVVWEKNNGYSFDTDVAETGKIAEGFYGLKSSVYYGDDVNIENIKKFLVAGYPVIFPAAGQMLGNPNFTGEGPPYHMLTITGFDEQNFITNDPGTKFGKDYKYPYNVLMEAIHDWNGSKETIKEGSKAILVLK